MEHAAFDLVAAKIEAVKARMLADLNREIFRSVSVTPVRPLTRRERVALKLAMVRGYFSTLWRALKGDDPYDIEHDW